MHLTNPDLQAKLDRWVTETGRGPDELVEDAMAGYFDELARTRQMLDSRYDDLKSGRVKPIDGEEFLENLRRREDELLKKHNHLVQPIPGVVQFLGNLSEAGIRTGLATSASRKRALGTLEELGLAHYFHTIVTGDDVTAGKPDPALYRLAAERMQESPECLLAVEDAASGVKSARAAGMRCLGIASAARAHLLQAAGADLIIPDFRSFSLLHLEAYFLLSV